LNEAGIAVTSEKKQQYGFIFFVVVIQIRIYKMGFGSTQQFVFGFVSGICSMMFVVTWLKKLWTR